MDPYYDYFDFIYPQVNGQNVGGITVTASCCLAQNFADDDVVPIDYNDVSV